MRDILIALWRETLSRRKPEVLESDLICVEEGEIKGRGWFFSSQTLEKPRRPGWKASPTTLLHRIFHTYGVVGFHL
jgi:hypothetical protein